MQENKRAFVRATKNVWSHKRGRACKVFEPADGNRKWPVFLFTMSWHYHIYIVRGLSNSRDDYLKIWGRPPGGPSMRNVHFRWLKNFERRLAFKERLKWIRKWSITLVLVSRQSFEKHSMNITFFFLSGFIRHLFYIASIFIVIVVQIIIVDDELKY